MAETDCQQLQSKMAVLQGLTYTYSWQDLNIKPKTEDMVLYVFPVSDLREPFGNILQTVLEQHISSDLNVSEESGSRSKEVDLSVMETGQTGSSYMQVQDPKTPRNELMVNEAEDVVMNDEEEQDDVIEEPYSQRSTDSGYSGQLTPGPNLSIADCESLAVQQSLVVPDKISHQVLFNVQNGQEEQGLSHQQKSNGKPKSPKKNNNKGKGNVKIGNVQWYRQEIPKLWKQIEYPNTTDESKVRNMWAWKNRPNDYPKDAFWGNPNTNKKGKRPQKKALHKMYSYMLRRLKQRTSTSFSPVLDDHNKPMTVVNATDEVTPAGLATAYVPSDQFENRGYSCDSQVARTSYSGTPSLLIQPVKNINSNQQLVPQDAQQEGRPYSEVTSSCDHPFKTLDIPLTPDVEMPMPLVSTHDVNRDSHPNKSSTFLTKQNHFGERVEHTVAPVTASFAQYTDDKTSTSTSSLLGHSKDPMLSSILDVHGDKACETAYPVESSKLSDVHLKIPQTVDRFGTSTTQDKFMTLPFSSIDKDFVTSTGDTLTIYNSSFVCNISEIEKPMVPGFHSSECETPPCDVKVPESLYGHVPANMEPSIHSSPINSEFYGDDQLATVMKICGIKDTKNLQAGAMT